MKQSFEEVRKILPQRFPILMIDGVLDYVPGEYLIASKAISGSDPVLQGHYPGFAIFPGVYLIEAMAQAASLLAHHSRIQDEVPELAGRVEGVVPLLASVDKARFRSPVLPGMLLRIEARYRGRKMRSVFYHTEIKHNDKRICDAQLSCSIVELDRLNGK